MVQVNRRIELWERRKKIPKIARLNICTLTLLGDGLALTVWLQNINYLKDYHHQTRLLCDHGDLRQKKVLFCINKYQVTTQTSKLSNIPLYQQIGQNVASLLTTASFLLYSSPFLIKTIKIPNHSNVPFLRASNWEQTLLPWTVPQNHLMWAQTLESFPTHSYRDIPQFPLIRSLFRLRNTSNFVWLTCVISSL